ncbi:adhesion G protein-coupled receptor E1-like, partial [Onychomys torridus]|uniref:adhesion G protein-coupled receptor E1-like n=1 Tax=Onychomys torridus TaxID=38674 RepID=UPI00167F24B4
MAVPKSLPAVSLDSCIPQSLADTALAQRPSAWSFASAQRPAVAPAPPRPLPPQSISQEGGDGAEGPKCLLGLYDKRGSSLWLQPRNRIRINSILLAWTLWVLKQKICSVSTEVSKLKDTRLLTFKAIAQIFILGCSWVLGIFQIGSIASIMAYLFTIINSLQGAFIFLIHCLLNRQIRDAYRKVITRKTEPSSHSQTSGVLLLSTQSTSKT